jgi:hypothetical protein
MKENEMKQPDIEPLSIDPGFIRRVVWDKVKVVDKNKKIIDVEVVIKGELKYYRGYILEQGKFKTLGVRRTHKGPYSLNPKRNLALVEGEEKQTAKFIGIPQIENMIKDMLFLQ